MIRDLETPHLTLSMLLEMNSVKDAQVHLFTTSVSLEWVCVFELSSRIVTEGVNIRISNRHDNPSIAVSMTYEKWKSMMRSTPELTPTLLLSRNDDEPGPVFNTIEERSI